jgi:hypothetical protein
MKSLPVISFRLAASGSRSMYLLHGSVRIARFSNSIGELATGAGCGELLHRYPVF